MSCMTASSSAMSGDAAPSRAWCPASTAVRDDTARAAAAAARSRHHAGAPPPLSARSRIADARPASAGGSGGQIYLHGRERKGAKSNREDRAQMGQGNRRGRSGGRLGARQPRVRRTSHGWAQRRLAGQVVHNRDGEHQRPPAHRIALGGGGAAAAARDLRLEEEREAGQQAQLDEAGAVGRVPRELVQRVEHAVGAEEDAAALAPEDGQFEEGDDALHGLGVAAGARAAPPMAVDGLAVAGEVGERHGSRGARGGVPLRFSSVFEGKGERAEDGVGSNDGA